jgi:hypothetical protein
MEIKLKELRLVTEKLYQHLDDLGVESVVINDDYYWSIPREDLYQPYQEPGELTIGQLSDDWRDLEKVLRGELDPIASNLVDLAAILKVVGQILCI